MSTLGNAIDSGQTLGTSSNVTFANISASAITATTVVATSGYSQHSISTTTTLSTSDYGKQVVCTGSSAYAVTLPAQTAGKYIDIQVITTSNALVTLTPASGTIQLQTTIVLGTGESCRLYTDGTNWWVENLSLMPVDAVYTMTTGSVTISNTGTLVIPFNTKVIDALSFFTGASTYKWLPLYPGNYLITGAWQGNQSASGGYIETQINLNGSALYYGATEVSTTSSATTSVTGTVALNGSTDYITIVANNHGGATTTINSNGQSCYFTASRIALF